MVLPVENLIWFCRVHCVHDHPQTPKALISSYGKNSQWPMALDPWIAALGMTMMFMAPKLGYYDITPATIWFCIHL